MQSIESFHLVLTSRKLVATYMKPTLVKAVEVATASELEEVEEEAVVVMDTKAEVEAVDEEEIKSEGLMLGLSNTPMEQDWKSIHLTTSQMKCGENYLMK